MDLFNSHNIEKMAARRDLDGLYRLLSHTDKAIRLEAAFALADLDDGFGWRYLMEMTRQTEDTDSQIVAAGMLGDLGHSRAVPVLSHALEGAQGELAEVIKEALEAIGGQEADEALRRAGYEPVLPRMSSNQQTIEYDPRYVRGVIPDTSRVEFLTPEQHFNNAVDLREAELTERALVENSLALWLAPEWSAAWYLRGVLFEDSDRCFEAALCYRWALELDPNHAEAREALDELERDNTFTPLEVDLLMADLGSERWQDRRDAAAGFGELGEDTPVYAVEALVGMLNDEEREVCHAVIEALGNIEDERAVKPLLACEESSWLLRFSVIEALAQIGHADAVSTVLRREMDRVQQRNPVFSRNKDPMLEVEYDRLMEVGVLALEKTGDLDVLISLAEGNTWVEVEGAEDEEEKYFNYGKVEDDFDEAEDEEEEEESEDLTSYVDEVALMVSLALERLAMPNMANLDTGTLRRIAALPDLTLLDVSNGEEAPAEPTLVHDLSLLREAAKTELATR